MKRFRDQPKYLPTVLGIFPSREHHQHLMMFLLVTNIENNEVHTAYRNPDGSHPSVSDFDVIDADLDLVRHTFQVQLKPAFADAIKTLWQGDMQGQAINVMAYQFPSLNKMDIRLYFKELFG